MPQSALCIDDQTLTQIFKGCPREFANLARVTQQAALSAGILDSPRDEYPLFEHLIIWLYARRIRPNLSKTVMFGPKLSTTQKTNLGEAIDYLIYSNFLPYDAALSHRVSFISLCYHDKFGFRDDPVLLQRMWYIQAYVLLEDNPDGVGPGERWKWFDHRLALVIYSWVRHNRKYHGCPKTQCYCRHLIDSYGVSIGTFKSLYMALEKACISQLQFVRSNDPVWSPSPGSTSRSRADDIKLYFKPVRKVWPHCFAAHITEPDPIAQSPVSPIAMTPVTPLNATGPKPFPHVLTQLQLNGLQGPIGSTLPPPHPSLPARPAPYGVTPSLPGVKALQVGQPFNPERDPAGSTWPALAGRPDSHHQSIPPPTQPPPPAEAPPPVPPPQARFTPTAQFRPDQNQSTNANIGPTTNFTIGLQTAKGNNSIPMPSASSTSTSANMPTAPADSAQPIPAPSSQSSGTSREVITAPSTPSTSNASVASPVMHPVSPAKPSLPGLATWMTSIASVSQQAIPSAPRSMREVKAASSGPIPTGPRALSGVKPMGGGSNFGRGPVYAGVPSAPRSMRVSVASVGGSDSGGPQRNENGRDALWFKNNDEDSDDPISVYIHPRRAPPNLVKSGKTDIRGEPILPPIRHSSPPILTINKPGPLAPHTLQATTGKRSRSETKADEIVAAKEMEEKAAGTLTSKLIEPSTPEVRKASEPVDEAPPSLPPAKRAKTLPEPESPTRSANKPFMTRKSGAKDGVSILAAVTKSKAGGGAKAAAQEKGVGNLRKGPTHEQTMPEFHKFRVELGLKPRLAGSQEPSLQHLEKSAPNVNVVSSASGPLIPVPEKAEQPKPMNGVSAVPSEKSAPASVSSTSSQTSRQTGTKQAAASESGLFGPSNDHGASDALAVEGQFNPVKQVPSTSRGTRKGNKAQTTAIRAPNSKGSAASVLSRVSPSDSHNTTEGTDGKGVGKVPSTKNPREKARSAKPPSTVLPSAEPPAATVTTVVTRKTARSRAAKKANAQLNANSNDDTAPTERGREEQNDREVTGEESSAAIEAESTADSMEGTRIKMRADPVSAFGSMPRGKRAVPRIRLPKGVEIIEISSDESVANKEDEEGGMELDKSAAPPTTTLPKGKIDGIAPSKPQVGPTELPSIPRGDVMDISETVTALQRGPPFPTVLVQASDPEMRMQTPQHEARRLMCALIGVGVHIDWWMVGITGNGFIILDEAAPLIVPLMKEATLRQLNAIGITIQITPAEPTSDSDEEKSPAQATPNLNNLPSQLQTDKSLPLVISDGLPERRLRSQEAEERRLRNLVHGLLGRPLLNASLEKNAFDHMGGGEVLRLVCPKDSLQLDSTQVSRLGKAGLVVYQGNTQLAGPLSIGPPIHSKSDSNPERFDWRAMRTEVMKMKLPWEMAGDSPASPASLPYSSSTPLHSSSSFTEQELSPADMHFRQLLRPRLWSSSNTFSRMAAAGMRWGEFDGVDPNSTDESGSDEPDEPRLGSTIRA